jgi:hypothetical protein
MKKALCMALVGLLAWGATALAGPTFGIGAGWGANAIWIAPSFGVQYLPEDSIGASSTMHLGAVNMVSGNYSGTLGCDPCPTYTHSLYLSGFWEIVTLTVPVFDLANGPWRDPCETPPCAPVGGKLKFLLGVGTPYTLVWVNNELSVIGAALGVTIGAAIENFQGTGLKIMAYYDGVSNVGVGVGIYFDLFAGREWGI